MSLITDLIAHIEANSSTFVSVDLAWTMQPFDDPTVNAPAIFIYQGKEESKPSKSDMCVIQESVKEVNVMHVCPIVDGETIQAEINSLVQGWQYNSNHTPLEHKFSEPQEIRGEYMWVLETFLTTYQRRSSQ